MAHAFKTISAKPTYGTLRRNLSQTDYVNQKKGIISYTNSCSQMCDSKTFNNYNSLNSYNIGLQTLKPNKCNINPVNKTNLVYGQYSKVNLNNVCTIAKGPPPSVPCSSANPCDPCQNNEPVTIDFASTVPFYFQYTIDPLGELFGRSQCGELNYTLYQQ